MYINDSAVTVTTDDKDGTGPYSGSAIVLEVAAREDPFRSYGTYYRSLLHSVVRVCVRLVGCVVADEHVYFSIPIGFHSVENTYECASCFGVIH